jgi:hypothetical protein
MSLPTKRIAMWSGPRNLSTAMMYSFAQRTDCSVVDEPFYAAYLAATGIKHAMYKEIISAGEVDSVKVAEECTQKDIVKPLYYQKHMTKHMIPSFDRNWIDKVCNVFLIRDPARVIASYHAKQQDPELSDIGVKEQVELFDIVAQKTGEAPTVINSADILAAPESMLRALCEAIDIEFQSNMLTWEKGAKSYDGVWAPHWYKSVWQSTGFASPADKKAQVPEHLLGLLETANHYYERLNEFEIVGKNI